jgi:hypothetical protein
MISCAMPTSSTTAVCANSIILRNRRSTSSSRSQRTAMTIPYRSAHFVSHISSRKKQKMLRGRQNARNAQAVDAAHRRIQTPSKSAPLVLFSLTTCKLSARYPAVEIAVDPTSAYCRRCYEHPPKSRKPPPQLPPLPQPRLQPQLPSRKRDSPRSTSTNLHASWHAGGTWCRTSLH